MATVAISTTRLRLEQLDELSPLIAGYQRSYGAYEPDENRNRQFFPRFLESDDSGMILGAHLDSTLVGFATLYWTFSSVAARDTALLNDLFVDPGFRKRGVARTLLSACVAEAESRGFHRLDWFTQSENTTAQLLYDAVAESRLDRIEYSIELNP